MEGTIIGQTKELSNRKRLNKPRESKVKKIQGIMAI